MKPLKKWHKLLDHCNVANVKNLEGVVQGMIISDSSKFDYKACTLAKQVNVRSKQPDVGAICPFELMHIDLVVPIDPLAKDGFKYVISFTGDFSGCLIFLKKNQTQLMLLKGLADTALCGKIKTLIFYDDVFSSGKVKLVCSNNGGEYFLKEFWDLLTQNSVKHECTSPYSSHQNDKANRNWCTLFDITRSMLKGSSLPKYLWTYAVTNATYVRSRCHC